jgi:hypothetical protein
MIRIKVYAPPWCRVDKMDERGWLELPDGSKLGDVLKVIHLSQPVAALLRASVNGVVSAPSTRLEDGDVIGFFSLFSGG